MPAKSNVDPPALYSSIASGKLPVLSHANRLLASTSLMTSRVNAGATVHASNDELDALKGKPGIFDGFRKGIARKTRGFLAPEAIVQCVEAAVNQPFDEAIRFEREQFVKLVTSHQSIAQRYCFFAVLLMARLLWYFQLDSREAAQFQKYLAEVQHQAQSDLSQA